MLCMECLHAHIPSHSPTPSHMPMPSVTTFTGSTNDTQIPSPYQLTSTQCKCQCATNPESIPTPITQREVYVITLCLILGNGSFRITTRVSYTYRTFRIIPRVSYTHRTFRITSQVSYTHKTFRITPRVSYTHVPGFSL